MSVSLIWAMSENGVIGKDNELPWRLPADLKFFKEQTTGKTMIMGRKTWESLGCRPLPNRRSVVMTGDRTYQAEGADVVHSVEEAMQYEGQEELMIIGGAGIFQHFIPLADTLYVTKINESIDGDVFFPQFNWDEFELVRQTPGIRDDKNVYDYTFMLYQRKVKSVE